MKESSPSVFKLYVEHLHADYRLQVGAGGKRVPGSSSTPHLAQRPTTKQCPCLGMHDTLKWAEMNTAEDQSCSSQHWQPGYKYKAYIHFCFLPIPVPSTEEWRVRANGQAAAIYADIGFPRVPWCGASCNGVISVVHRSGCGACIQKEITRTG